MKVRLTCDRAGRTGYYLAGEVLDVPEPEARRMVLAGLAEPFIEAAAVAAPENAARPRPAHRRK